MKDVSKLPYQQVFQFFDQTGKDLEAWKNRSAPAVYCSAWFGAVSSFVLLQFIASAGYR